MKVTQLVALMVAAVSLVVIAVFSTLSYFEPKPSYVLGDPVSPFEVRTHWDSVEAWGCVNAYVETLEIEGYSFGLSPRGTARSEILKVIDGVYWDCFDLVVQGVSGLEE